MNGTLFTLPDSTNLLGAMSSTSAPFVQDFLPLIYVIGGLLVAAIILWLLIGTLGKITKSHSQ